jgi:3-phenylpropionate/trans-cinnamate dioxygenase ferredoxin reductase subunit
VGHAEAFDRVIVSGSLDGREATIGYADGERIRAIATINRDRDSLLAERAFETGDQAALRALL